jgi:hypothetical protein
MTAPILIGAGINIGAGVNVGAGAAPTGGTITYAQMNPPVIAGNQLADISATVNNPIGFTINNGASTGVAVPALTLENQTFFTNQGPGYFTASFGPGSTYSTATVQITYVSGGGMVFYIDPGLGYPATFNYPFVIA